MRNMAYLSEPYRYLIQFKLSSEMHRQCLNDSYPLSYPVVSVIFDHIANGA